MKKGFTLIEVLITLSIFVILISIVSPNYVEIKKMVDKNKYILNSVLIYDYVKGYNEKNGVINLNDLETEIENNISVSDVRLIIGGKGVKTIKYVEDDKELELKIDDRNFTYKLYMEGDVIYSGD